jgi:hypothetical protein
MKKTPSRGSGSEMPLIEGNPLREEKRGISEDSRNHPLSAVESNHRLPVPKWDFPE